MAVCWVWLRPAPFALKAAALSLSALIVTPYVSIYDFPIAAIPMAYLIKHGLANGFRPGERMAMLALALAPVYLFGRLLAGYSFHPVMPIVLPVLMGLIVLRAARQPPQAVPQTS